MHNEICKCFCHTRDGLTICPDCEPVHNSRDYQLRCADIDDCSICGKPMSGGNHPQCVAVMSGGAE